MGPSFDYWFWSRWVVANSLAELIGLGTVGLVGYAFLRYAGEPSSALAVLSFAGLAILLGAFEGAIVGLFQRRVLLRRLPRLESWVTATVIGAVAAWFLGMVPSTIVQLQGSPGQASASEVSDLLQLLLAVPLGAVAGLVLAIAQWRVLRRYVPGAGRWLVANALAWTLGMPLVFVAAGAGHGDGVLGTIAIVVLSLCAAGAIVGAVHGWFLCRLLASSDRRYRDA